MPQIVSTRCRLAFVVPSSKKTIRLPLRARTALRLTEMVATATADCGHAQPRFHPLPKHPGRTRRPCREHRDGAVFRVWPADVSGQRAAPRWARAEATHDDLQRCERHGHPSSSSYRAAHGGFGSDGTLGFSFDGAFGACRGIWIRCRSVVERHVRISRIAPKSSSPKSDARCG